MPFNYVSPAADGIAVAEKMNDIPQPVVVQKTMHVEDIVATPEQDTVEAMPEVKDEEPVPEEQNKREHTSWIFDPIEAPTLAHQEKVVYELNISSMGDEPTMNDKLKTNTAEVAHILHDVPIRDLKKAISINDRHRFIEDLFRGDETMYERSIKTINNFNNFAEAEFWMQRELKLKLAWDNNSSQVKLFDQLVRRRFS
jgi:hypothetical protein